jgi:RHS repeat-associated protein
VTDDAGNLLAGFVFDGDQPLARYGVGGTRYYLEDEHGSVIATADGAGAIASLARYDSFGNIVESMGEAQPQNLTGGDFRFHGMWLDATTHLYDARARSYDPVIGRFLSPDAIQPDPRLPETFDRYRFANANPHVFTDPTGLFSLAEAQATGQIERIMQQLQLEIRRNAVEEAKEAVENVVGNLLASAVAQVVPGGSQLETAISGFTAIAQGRAFEDWLEEQLCSQLPNGTDVLTDILYLTVPLGHDGRPTGSGTSCAPSTSGGPSPFQAPSRTGRMSTFNTLFTVFPDAVLSPQSPQLATTSRPRTYLIADFKIRARTVRGGSDQTQAIIRHAGGYSWSRAAIFFTLFRATRADQQRLISYSSGNGVYARIVSLL